MNYQEFVDKICTEGLADEFLSIPRFHESKQLKIKINDWHLSTNFTTVYFMIFKLDKNYKDIQYYVRWNLFDKPDINIVLNPDETYTEPTLYKDDMDKDEFFNVSLSENTNLTYEQYLELGNIYKRLEELYRHKIKD